MKASDEGRQRAPLQSSRLYPRCHLRYGLVSPIQGAPNSAGTSLYRRLYLPKLKLKTRSNLCFDVDLFRHVVLRPSEGMEVRIRRQGCRRKNGGARMAIAVRSAKTEMTKRGNLRSRPKNGAKPRRRRAAIEPSDTDACTV
ncbi:Uncharacterised protein [Hafnia alvei]|jgi:hypothetical protein|nr:Uncharacterised protein [Hafnia alvei]